MNAVPQADPLALAAPPWIFHALLLVMFALHLLPMNFVLGGSIIAAVARWRGRRANRPFASKLSSTLAAVMPAAVSVAVSLGVAALLFLQVLYGRLFFTSSVLMAAWWSAAVVVLIVAYVLIARRATSLAAPLVAFIAFVYTANMAGMVRAGEFLSRYRADSLGLHLDVADPTLVPRFLHMLLGAIAVGGLSVAVIGVTRRRADPDFARWTMRHGCVWCGAATAANLAAGSWWLFALPGGLLFGGLGQSALIAVVLAVAVLVAIAALMLAVAATQVAEPATLVKAAVGTLATTIALMVLLRDQVRQATIARFAYTLPARVATDWVPGAIFLVLLVVAIVVIGWMVTTLARSWNPAEAGSHGGGDLQKTL